MQPTQNIPSTLYHYTTADSFLGIINNKELWATKIQYMNDSSELAYAIDILKEVLSEMEKEEQDIFKGNILRLLRAVIPYIYDLSFYVVCFSRVVDSLGQWRGYGSTSTGYCVGFDTKALIDLSNSRNWIIGRCSYVANEHNLFVGSWVEKTVLSVEQSSGGKEKFYANFGSGSLSKDVNKFINEYLSDSIIEFLKQAIFMKHPSFIAEEEWRIIVLERDVKKLNFRKGASMLIPYSNLDLLQLDQLISEIWIGPSPHPELAKKSIKMLLEKNTLKPQKIENSKIPFRGW